MKKIIPFFVLTLFIAGCTGDLELIPEEATNDDVTLNLTEEELRYLPILTGKSHTIDMDEATQRAQDAISFLAEEEGSTRSYQNARRIKSISPVTMPKTRSSSEYSFLPDTLIYICNFTDDMGFTIISADNRIPRPVLAIVESGNLSESIDNPGLAIFLAGAEDYIVRSIEEYESKKDSMDAVITWKIESALPAEAFVKTRAYEAPKPGYSISEKTTTTWRTTKRVSPLLPVEWGQEIPYNADCPRVTGTNSVTGKVDTINAPTGCVATAAAQIMAYWKFPEVIDGHHYDWDELNKYSDQPYRPGKYKNWEGYMRYDAPDTIRQDVAKLMRFIGKEVNMKYKYKISNSDGGDLVPEMLQNLGYRNASTTDGAYNYSKIKSCLDSKRPIYIEGYEEKIKFLGMTVNYDGGHAWVIDGYIEQYLDKTTTITITYIATGNIVYKETIRDYNPSPETKSFIHHNWGWGGHYNGYFAPESYDSRNAMQKESNATRGSAGNFKYGHSFYYNIQP